MADNYGYSDKAPKTPPGYIGPGAKAMELLQQFMSGIGQGGFNSAIGDARAQVGTPGAYQTISGLLPRLGAFIGKGSAAADAYQKQGLQATRKSGIDAMNMLGGATGASGNIGSTIAGLSNASTLGDILGQANDVRANAAGMRESNIQGRMGLGIQGLSQLGNMVSTDRGQNMQATQNIAGMVGQNDQAVQNQYLQGFGAQAGVDQGPMNQWMDIWSTIMNKPKSPSGTDMILGGLGALIPLL